MKDIYYYLHEQEDITGTVPDSGLSEREKQEVLSYIRKREAEEKYASHSSAAVMQNAEERSAEQVKRRVRVSTAAAILAAALTVGGSVFAAIRWNRGLEEGMQISEEKKEQLETDQMAVTVGQSCTKGDVTVTADQCIVDNYYAYLSFTVRGYEPAEGADPIFEQTVISAEGIDHLSGTGRFYNGIIMGPDGRGIYADGTEIDRNSGEPVTGHYVQEDGSMQYLWMVSSGGEKGLLTGKTIHVELVNLGTARRAAFTPGVQETWTFDWTLPENSVSREFEPDMALGDTEAVVKTAEISPISLYVTMDVPRQEETDIIEWEDGNTEIFTFWKEAPRLTGVRLKDGSLLPYVTDGGSSYYPEEEGDLYIQRYGVDRVLDIDQIDALLFVKDGTPSGEIPTEDHFYVVPLS